MQTTFQVDLVPTFYWPVHYAVTDSTLPLVSCIMPTANRHEFIPKSVQYFLRQDYPYKELVIIDDGTESVSNLLPNIYSIRYFYLKPENTVGYKRNIACEKAAGSIIVHWDDDDWYAPNWISHQVKTLIENDAEICGLSHVQFYSVKRSRYYLTKNVDATKHWLCCATLAYRKSFWNKHPFKHTQIGEDIFFSRNKAARVIAHNYLQGFLAIVHSTNVKIKEF